MTNEDTAKDVREAYEVDEHGIIRSPGKFEDEAIYVPYLWENTTDNPAEIEVTAEDRELFPELGDAKTIYLYENNDGFVMEINAKEFEQIELSKYGGDESDDDA